MFIETVLNARAYTHTHRGTCTHKHSDYTKLNIHTAENNNNNRELIECFQTQKCFTTYYGKTCNVQIPTYKSTVSK